MIETKIFSKFESVKIKKARTSRLFYFSVPEFESDLKFRLLSEYFLNK